MKFLLVVAILAFSFLVISLSYSLEVLSNINPKPKGTSTSNSLTNVTPISITTQSSRLNFTATTSLSETNTTINSINFNIDLLIIATLISIFLLVLLFTYSFTSGRPTFSFGMKRTYSESGIIDEFKGILERSLEDFDAGYSKSSNPIITLYAKICSFLEKKGAKNAPSLTAREFEENVYKILKFKSNNFHELTLIFEETKYSNHEINQEKIEYVKKLVEKIIEELKNV